MSSKGNFQSGLTPHTLCRSACHTLRQRPPPRPGTPCPVQACTPPVPPGPPKGETSTDRTERDSRPRCERRWGPFLYWRLPSRGTPVLHDAGYPSRPSTLVVAANGVFLEPRRFRYRRAFSGDCVLLAGGRGRGPEGGDTKGVGGDLREGAGRAHPSGALSPGQY